MTPPPWYITDHAITCYLHARGWPDNEANAHRAELELEQLSAAATYRSADTMGRELWRSPKRRGAGLRWVVDPRRYAGSPLPRVAWVGHGRPPTTLFAASPASPQCPVCSGGGVHKPTGSGLLEYECERCGWFFHPSNSSTTAAR